jgi:hypothetical protein
MAVYLSGILIGGIYTPDVMSYAKQISANKNVEQQMQPLPQKPKQLKKGNTKITPVV